MTQQQKGIIQDSHSRQNTYTTLHNILVENLTAHVDEITGDLNLNSSTTNKSLIRSSAVVRY